jgi:GNAT superfamily N-acetyltransferase
MADEQLTIRPFHNDDKQSVINVVGKTLVGEGIIPQSDLPIDDPDLHNIPSYYSGKSMFWVAVLKESIVGTVGLKDKGGAQAKLRRMFVLHTLHGTGIGQKLLDTALTYAKQQGFTSIVLNTHECMKRAHRFYEKNGFILQSGGAKLHAYRYEKHLK